MKYILITSFFFTSIISFSKQKNEIIPPNGFKISDTSYIDKTEVSNLDYQEYCYWTSRVFGKNEKYYSTLPKDFLIWDYKYAKDTLEYIVFSAYRKYYSTHPAYNYYPVIGITYEQANLYCKWREDRIYEMSLVYANILDLYSNQNQDNYFTIDNFLNGNYKVEIRNTDKIKSVPIFRCSLPTKEEYEYLFSIEKTKKYYNKSDTIRNEILSVQPLNKRFKPIVGIYYAGENVSEMTNIDGIAYGLNWRMNSIQKNLLIQYNEPTNWLGFRCIATIEYLK